jgi:glutamate/tyrosine decarboxylase-like PLP-dependent enzyme
MIPAAIIGIGSKNVVGIKPDEAARVDLDDLEKHLEESLSSQRAVYAVVAIIGYAHVSKRLGFVSSADSR